MDLNVPLLLLPLVGRCFPRSSSLDRLGLASMADLISVYALPLPPSSQTIPKTCGKRKRNRSVHLQEEGDDGSDTNTEYSAIITPEERAQRRLAGQALDHPPPSAPFPHAPPLESSVVPDEDGAHYTDHVLPLEPSQPYSLRYHHLAVMTAILHKSLQQGDYVRASKAMAVVLRTEVLGRSVDLRHAGFWCIAAEILLRDNRLSADHTLWKSGFGKAKLFYDKLARQHPWHRSWPAAINAQDFKISMFSLWIYAVCIENRRLQEQESDRNLDSASPSSRSELQAKRWELGEAEAIAKEMDALMGTIPFIDDIELIRLRAMVALWMADLLDDIDSLTTDVESDTGVHEPTLYDYASIEAIERQRNNGPKPNEKATAARELSKTLFSRLNMTHDD